MSVRVRYTGEGVDSSAAETEDTITVDEITSVSPAPAGPGWGEMVNVVVHHFPETEETEGGFEAVTMTGVPLGVSISAFDDTAREALDRLLWALAAFGYTGVVTVEDATGLGPNVTRYGCSVATVPKEVSANGKSSG